MRPLMICFALSLLLVATPVSTFAQEVEKTAEVPFREDSGLITAEYYLATGKYTQALDVLGGVMQRQPASADAHAYRGFAYYKLGDLKKARQSFTHALSINSRHLGANKYLANLWLAEDNLPRALEQLQALLYICAGTHCAEVDELQGEINRYKAQPAKKSAR